MTDQEVNSEEVEVAPQQTELDESTQQANDVQEVEDNTENVVDDQQDRNWRAMRQRQKELEMEIRRRDELIEKALLNQQPPQSVPQVEEDLDDPDDEYVPAGRVRKIANKQVKPLEQKIADLEAKISQQEQHKRLSSLRTNFSDFDDVVNVETLELLEKNEPDLAAAINKNKDPYDMGVQCYKYIKALGLADQLPTARRKKEVDKKLESNAKSVQTPQAYDKRPIAQAMKSTAADKKRLYEEMMYYAGQASGI